jgi:hypothetical protein
MKAKEKKIGAKVKGLITFALISSVLILAGLGLSNSRFVIADALQANPENFTELYFVDHQLLPRQIEIGEKYGFSFKVRNLENKTLDYHYEIYLTDKITRKMLKKGEFSLINGQETSIPVDFETPDNTGEMQVSVFLVNKRQEVSFWVDKIEAI